MNMFRDHNKTRNLMAVSLSKQGQLTIKSETQVIHLELAVNQAYFIS